MLPNLSHAATATWTNGGGTGLWSTPGNWSGGAVPAFADSVIFSASSTANATIDVNTQNIYTLTITPGYTGTITLATSSVLNADDATFISYTLGGFFQAGGTFVDNGTLSIGTLGGFTLSGGTFIQGSTGPIDGGLYGGVPKFYQTGGTFQGGGGAISVASFSLTGGSFISTMGTLSVSSWYMTSAGTFTPNNGTVIIGSNDISASTTFNNLSFAGNSNNCLSSSHLVVNGTLTLTGSTTICWSSNGAQIIANGNVVDNNTAYGNNIVYGGSGFTNIILSGSGTQTFTGSSVLGAGALPSITVNNPGGTVIFQNGVTFAGNLNIASGTVNFGTSTVAFYPRGSQTFSASSPLNIPNMGFGEDGLSAASLTLASGTMINVSNDFTYFGNGLAQILGNGSINVGGNLIDINTSQGHSDPGNSLASITLNGTGTQYIYATSTGLDVGVLPAGLVINKTTGTLYPVGIVNLPIANGGGWNQISAQGTVNTGTSTVVLDAGSQWCGNGNSSATLSGATQFNNLEIYGDFCVNYYYASVESITVSTTTTPVVNGTFTMALNSGSSSSVPPPINGGTLQINGNLVAPAPSVTLRTGYGGGTATIAVMGTSTQTFTNNLGTYWQMPQLLINTPNKTALMGYGQFLLGSTTIQQGEFWIPSSSLNVMPSLNLGGNMTISSTGALRIFQPSSTLANGTNVNVTITNNGLVHIDAPNSGCSQSPTVTLTGGASNKIVWAGSGKNIIRYVTASYQSSAVPITTVNSLDGSPGNTNTNFVFPALQSPVQLIQQTNIDCIYICHGESASTQWGVRPGDTIIVSLVNDGLTSPVITDNASNIYRLITTSTVVTTQNGNPVTLSLYYVKNASGTAPLTLSTSFPNGDGTWDISDYTGISPSSTLEAWNSNSVVASGTVTVNTGYVSTSFAQDLFYAAETTGWGNGAGAPLAPFSGEMMSGGDWADGYGPTLNVGDYISTTTQSMTASWSALSPTFAGVIAAFRSAIVQYYPPKGVLDSATYDLRSPAALNSFTWRGTTPAGSSVNFQFAVSNSPSGPWNYVGPDGTANTVYSGMSGTPIPFQTCSLLSSCYSLFNNFQYFRYRVTLLSNGLVTPTVTGVMVRWSL